jgi:hypothetical protein
MAMRCQLTFGHDWKWGFDVLNCNPIQIRWLGVFLTRKYAGGGTWSFFWVCG